MLLRGFAVRENAVVTLDWMIISMMVMALGLAAGTFIRTGDNDLGPDHLRTIGGVPMLSSNDSLIAFEDFGHTAAGWTPAVRDDTDAAFAGILGRFGGSADGAPALSRTYTIEPGYSRVLVEFDLHAIDDWALEEVIIYTNGVEVARHSFSTRPDMIAGQAFVPSDAPGFAVAASRVDRVARGYGGGSAAMEDQVVRIRIEADVTGESLTLGFGSTLARDLTEASWAIDNVSVIASNPRPD